MPRINLGRVVGDSAYEVAVKNGFTGTENEWLESLKGDTGDKGDSGLSDLIGDVSDITDYDYEGTKSVEVQKINYKEVNTTVNGVHIIADGNGTFTLSGTATAGSTEPSLLSGACELEAGTYKYSIEVLEGTFPNGTSSWAFKCGNSDNEKLSLYFTSAHTGSKSFVASNNYRLYFTFASGAVFDITFKLKVFKEETVSVNKTAKDEKARSDIQTLLPLVSLRDEVDEIKESYPVVHTYDKDDVYTEGGSSMYYYNLSGTNAPENPTATSGTTKYACMVIPVNKGQQATIYTKGTNGAALAYAVTDLNRFILDKPTAADSAVDRTTANPHEVDITEEGYLYVNVAGTVAQANKVKVIIKESLLSKIDGVNDKVEGIEEGIDNIRETYPQIITYDRNDVYKDANNYEQYYWNLGGGVIPNSRTKDTSGSTATNRFASVGPIEILSGQHITVYTKGGIYARAYAITDKAKSVTELAESSLDITTTPLDYDVIEDGYLYVNCQWGSISQLKVIITDSMVNRLNNLNDKISGVNNVMPKINNLPFNPHLQSLRILHIGNSFSIDATAYLSGFIGAASPAINVDNLCIYRLAVSSGSFKIWTQRFKNNNNTDVLIAKVAGGINCTFNGIRQALCNNTWDLIVIQQVSTYSGEHLVWEGDGDGGYLKEFITILKTYQPSASIAFMMVHATHPDRSGKETAERWNEIADGCKFMKAEYGIDLVIPVGTAIENIRTTQVGNPLTRDNDHLGYGLARYVANACYFQSVIAARYGVSVLGNSYTRNTTTTEPDDSGSITHQEAIISVDSTNKELAQKAALLACTDMFTIRNPQNVSEYSDTPPVSQSQWVFPIWEKRLEIVNSPALSNNAFGAGFGKYYVMQTLSNPITINLPAVPNEQVPTITGFMVFVTAPSDEGVRFAANNSENIKESGLSDVEEGKTYEINAIWNGAAWVITTVEMKVYNPT